MKYIFGIILFFVTIFGTANMRELKWVRRFESSLGKIIEDYVQNHTNLNYVYSPISILQPLIVLYEASQNETKSEFDEFFGPNTDHSQAYPKNYQNIIDVILKIENSIFVDDRFKNNQVLTNFITNFKSKYPTIKNHDIIQNVNFRTGSAEACKKINQWVENNTNNLINQILSPSDIDCNTFSVIINTVYFDGEWLKPFGNTMINFTPIKNYTPIEYGQEKSIKGMKGTAIYKEFEDYQVLVIPYKNEKLSMAIYMPNNITAQNKNLLNVLLLDEMFNATLAQNEWKNIVMPIFKISMESTINFDVKNLLISLGLSNAMSCCPNYQNMLDQQIYIDKFRHMSVIIVDNNGTQAAAATLVLMNVKSFLSEPVYIPFNKPFLFQIRYTDNDKDEDYILFQGKINDPSLLDSVTESDIQS